MFVSYDVDKCNYAISYNTECVYFSLPSVRKNILLYTTILYCISLNKAFKLTKAEMHTYFERVFKFMFQKVVDSCT